MELFHTGVLLQGICNEAKSTGKPWCAVDVDIGVCIRADAGLILLCGPSLFPKDAAPPTTLPRGSTGVFLALQTMFRM